MKMVAVVFVEMLQRATWSKTHEDLSPSIFFFFWAKKRNVCTTTKTNLQNVCDCENNPKQRNYKKMKEITGKHITGKIEKRSK
jgi:hypothetical protein